MKTVEGRTKVFYSKEGDTVLCLLEAVEGAVEDCSVLCDGKILSLNQSLCGYGRDTTFRICGRLRGGSTRRPPPPDIPGQWTCENCYQERVWPTKNKCFRRGCPNPPQVVPARELVQGPNGRLPKISPPVNPTTRTPKQQVKQRNPRDPPPPPDYPPPIIPRRPDHPPPQDENETKVPGYPQAQILEVLQIVLTPEDFEKYRMQFVPPPRSAEASRAQELANKCREQSKLENQIKHYCTVIGDLETKLQKHKIIRSNLELQHQEISQKISVLKAEVAMPPPPPPRLHLLFQLLQSLKKSLMRELKQMMVK